ncbi:MAG: hypothetical protein ACFFB5_04045 [Promethearchaeota archaeon]
MSDNFSIFIIFSSNIIEICFSRDIRNYSKDSDETMDVSQFLLVLATQFLLQISQLNTHWKKWLFFVLISAVGEGFRIDSCRDYPNKKYTGVNIGEFLVNEYDLTVNITNRDCSLRIDPLVKNNFFKLIKNHNSKILNKGITDYSLPLKEDYHKDKIRTLDLNLIMKRSILVTPTLKQVQTWIMTWNPLTDAEFNQIVKEFSYVENVSELPIFLSTEEIMKKGLTDYREASLEQPWGLYCPKCKTTYKANIFAKTCYSCKTPLKRA